MLAVLPTDHPFAEYATIPLAALATEPFILLEEGHYYEPLDAFKSVGTAPNINYTIHDDYAILKNKKCVSVQTIPNIHRLMFWKMIHSPHSTADLCVEVGCTPSNRTKNSCIFRPAVV